MENFIVLLYIVFMNNPYEKITEEMKFIDDIYDDKARIAKNIEYVVNKTNLTFEQVRLVLFYNYEKYLYGDEYFI